MLVQLYHSLGVFLALSASPYPQAAHIFQQISLLDSAALLSLPFSADPSRAGHPPPSPGRENVWPLTGRGLLFSGAETVRVKLLVGCESLYKVCTLLRSPTDFRLNLKKYVINI